MSTDNEQAPATRFYFVDEAGDPTLFSGKKRAVVGEAGCSNYFILGKVEIYDPASTATQLDEVRQRILSDPYFRGVPSMQPERKKTALGFHAKDDLPEVRREVFGWLQQQSFRFFAVVRDKRVILEKVLQQNKLKPSYRYHPNQLYDRCVSELFKERLHKGDGFKIYFAKRGAKDRSGALRKALEAARADFRRKWKIEGAAPIEIVEADCNAVVCLQVVDYCLWALQRLYEKDEDRFYGLIAQKTGLIHDVDDVRESASGAYYTQRNPLTVAARAKKIAGGYRSLRRSSHGMEPNFVHQLH